MATKFSFDKVKENIAQVKKDLPRLWANDAQNYYLAAFVNEAWNGSHWKDVQRRDPNTNAYKYPKNKKLSRRTNKILIGTGRLRQAVANSSGNAHVTYKTYDFTVTLRVNSSVVPYAAYLNDGTEHMVARQYFGDSPALRRILTDRVKRFMDRVWK